MIEKILSKIREKRDKYADLANGSNFDGWAQEEKEYLAKEEVCEELIQIVQEVAKDDGWIPCSERLPEIAGHEVLATLENGYGQRRTMIIFTGYGLNPFWHCNHKEIDLNVWKVIAWKPLPAPYQKGE